MPLEVLDHYRRHGPWTEPGPHGPRLAALPESVDALAEVVRGLFVHGDWLSLYDLAPADFSGASRRTLPVRCRIDAVLAADPAPLQAARSLPRRAVATCRDYALLLCSLLRCGSVPARVRCGFANYLGGNPHEDHWVCEYWRHDDRRWALADAQMDAPHRAALGIDFDTLDLPAGRFLVAADAWSRHRSGAVAAEYFGHGDDRGAWFLRVNLARDLLALLGEEVSDWDRWREVPAAGRVVHAEATAWCDDTAHRAAAVAGAPADGRFAPPPAGSVMPPWWLEPPG